MSGTNINEEDDSKPPEFVTVPKPFKANDKDIAAGEYTFYSDENGSIVYQTKNDSVTFTADELDNYIDQGLINKNDYIDASTEDAFATPAYNPLHEAFVDQIYDALMKIPGVNRLGMDQQGEITMKLQKMFKSAGLREGKEQLVETKFYVFWNGKRTEIDGNSLWDAKQKAITQFKVPKSKIGLLTVVSVSSQENGDYRFA